MIGKRYEGPVDDGDGLGRGSGSDPGARRRRTVSGMRIWKRTMWLSQTTGGIWDKDREAVQDTVRRTQGPENEGLFLVTGIRKRRVRGVNRANVRKFTDGIWDRESYGPTTREFGLGRGSGSVPRDPTTTGSISDGDRQSYPEYRRRQKVSMTGIKKWTARS